LSSAAAERRLPAEGRSEQLCRVSQKSFLYFSGKDKGNAIYNKK
jgi:hypothetical protein